MQERTTRRTFLGSLPVCNEQRKKRIISPVKISVTLDACVKKYGKRARARVYVCVCIRTHLARISITRYGCNNDRDVTSDKCARRPHASMLFFRDVYGDRWDLTSASRWCRSLYRESAINANVRLNRFSGRGCVTSRLRWRRCTGKWLIKIIIKRLDMQIDTRINARMFLIRYLNLWLYDAEQACEIMWITNVKIARFITEMYELISPFFRLRGVNSRIFFAVWDNRSRRSRECMATVSYRNFTAHDIDFARIHSRSPIIRAPLSPHEIDRDPSLVDRQLSLARQHRGAFLIRYHRGETATVNHNRASLSSFDSPPPPPPPTRANSNREISRMTRTLSIIARC